MLWQSLHLSWRSLWVNLNSNRAKPILIDLVIKPFHGSNKSVKIIFVHTARSKKNEARSLIQETYNGTPKAYPWGGILIFILVPSKLEEDCMPQQHDLSISGHEQYLREEDGAVIFGLKCLKKKGKIIKIHDSSPEHLAFLQYANNSLSSPPKKCCANITIKICNNGN
jgi:hypothetical protein